MIVHLKLRPSASRAANLSHTAAVVVVVYRTGPPLTLTPGSHRTRKAARDMKNGERSQFLLLLLLQHFLSPCCLATVVFVCCIASRRCKKCLGVLWAKSTAARPWCWSMYSTLVVFQTYIAITPLTFIGAGFLVTLLTKSIDYIIGRKVRAHITQTWWHTSCADSYHVDMVTENRSHRARKNCTRASHGQEATLKVRRPCGRMCGNILQICGILWDQDETF